MRSPNLGRCKGSKQFCLVTRITAASWTMDLEMIYRYWDLGYSIEQLQLRFCADKRSIPAFEAKVGAYLAILERAKNEIYGACFVGTTNRGGVAHNGYRRVGFSRWKYSFGHHIGGWRKITVFNQRRRVDQKKLHTSIRIETKYRDFLATGPEDMIPWRKSAIIETYTCD